MDRFAIGHEARRTIGEESLRAFPEEGCGFLVGHGQDVLRALPRRNVHPGPRSTRFNIEGLEWVRLEDELEGGLDAILGVFHSHPLHPPVPSEADRGAAWPGLVYVIQAVPERGRLGELRAWRLDDRSVFRALDLG